MKSLAIEEHLRANPGSVEDAVRTLRGLVDSLNEDPGSWENPTLDRFLGAMLRWLETMQGRVGDQPCWELFSLMLEVGKDYE
jgi:hypothetical protein